MSELIGAAATARVGDIVELRIDALAAGGDGVGRTADGRVVFVPLTAPGDRVRARLAELHPRYARGLLERVLEAGAARATPVCEVFGVCGGCRWQHVDYAAQCEAKRRIVTDALVRVGRLALPAPVVFHPSPTPYAYRARTRVVAEAGRVGYRRWRSRELCAVRRCPVLIPPVEDALRALCDSPPPQDGEWELASGALGVRSHAVDAPGAEIELAIEGAPLRVSAGVFFQAHTGLHGVLVESLARAAGRGSLALELYAGAGFFTARLARAFERVIAVEADAVAVADLRHNVARASCASRVEIVHGRAEALLAAGQRLAGIRPDAVVLDPPRTGLARGAADLLCALAPERIAYLSCDPATLARDLAALAAGGFRLERVEAFDLFPQTPHVEALALLQRDAQVAGRRGLVRGS